MGYLYCNSCICLTDKSCCRSDLFIFKIFLNLPELVNIKDGKSFETHRFGGKNSELNDISFSIFYLGKTVGMCFGTPSVLFLNFIFYSLPLRFFPLK